MCIYIHMIVLSAQLLRPAVPMLQMRHTHDISFDLFSYIGTIITISLNDEICHQSSKRILATRSVWPWNLNVTSPVDFFC